MPLPAQRREERRKNLLALAIAFGIVFVAALFAWRPAPLLGVSESALANSVAGEVDILIEYGGRPKPRCNEEGGDRSVCVVRTNDSENPVARYDVTASRT